MSERVDGFTFFATYLDAVMAQPERNRAKLLLAIVQYGINGTETALNASQKSAFAAMKVNIDLSRKRHISGKKGGFASQAIEKKRTERNRNEREGNNAQGASPFEPNNNSDDSYKQALERLKQEWNS